MFTFLHIALFILSFCLFILRALNIGHDRVDLGWIGLACLSAALYMRCP